MGGGDLNTKKSWHPNTMKNQERVWKAEQAAAEEKKRILELQREREEERDRTQLKEMAQRNFGANSSPANNDNRLHWMYDKPDKQTQQEDYLLGKAIGKNEGDNAPQHAIPAVSRRVVGSSMTTTGDDSQVDLARKMREDPLLLVKERERAARAALLNNPLQRKKLTYLLRQEQDHKDSQKKENKKKKGNDLDNALAAKLNALAGKKGLDLTSLLNSDDSDSSSNNKKSKKKKKKKHEKKSKKAKKKQLSSESDTSDDVDTNKSRNTFSNKKDIKSSTKPYKSNKIESRKRQSDDSSDSDGESKRKKSRQDLMKEKSQPESGYSRRRYESREENGRSQTKPVKYSDRREKIMDHQDKIDRHYSGSSIRRSGQRGDSPDSPPQRDIRRGASPSKKRYEEDKGNKSRGLSMAEKAARLAEMAAAGMEREVERGHRVAKQRAEDAASGPAGASRALHHAARALPDSLESRIHSNRHYIQRDRRHMNEHFARR